MQVHWLLLRHRWKAFFRSPSWPQRLIIGLALSFFLLLLGWLLLATGLQMSSVLATLFPTESPVVAFHRGLLFYAIADLIGRFILQGTPLLDVGPYRHLPIKKHALINSVMARVPLTLFNVFPLLVVVPFALKVIQPQFGTLAAGGWGMAFGALLLIHSYLVFYARLQVALHPKWVLGGFLLLVGVVVLDRFGLIPVSQLSVAAFGVLVEAPGWAVAFWLVWLIVFYLAYRRLYQGLHEENLPKPPVSSPLRRVNPFLLRNYHNPESLLFINELKLIARHRRPRNTLLVSLCCMLYGVSVYINPENVGFRGIELILAGLLTTGVFSLNYGQFLFAWEGRYFEGLLASHIPAKAYVRSKYRLLSAACLLGYVLTLPFGLFGWPILVINTACCLFNIGVNCWMLIYVATFNRTRVDLRGSIFLNWQGVSSMQYLVVVLTLLLPFALYGLANWWHPWAGVSLLAGLGVIGWLTGPHWLAVGVRRFQKKKYTMAAGFRHIG